MTYSSDEKDVIQPSDEDLMRRTQGGDGAAFGQIVRRYEAPLFNYLRRMAGNAGEAEDLFQETMLRVYRSREGYDLEAPFRPWLYRIATNCCRDRLRYWRRRPSTSLDASLGQGEDGKALKEYLASGTPGPADEAQAAELRERIEAAIASLPVKHRAVFLMARYEGMPYEAIGESLGIPVGTVKSRMNKAVHTLMQQLAEFLP